MPQVISTLAVAMSLSTSTRRWPTITTQVLRGLHLGMVLLLSFLVFPPSRKLRGQIGWYDIVSPLASASCIAYMLWTFEDFIYRAVTPEGTESSSGCS